MKKTFKKYMTKQAFAEYKKLFLKEDFIGFNYLALTTLSDAPTKEHPMLVKFVVDIPDKKK